MNKTLRTLRQLFGTAPRSSEQLLALLKEFWSGHQRSIYTFFTVLIALILFQQYYTQTQRALTQQASQAYRAVIEKHSAILGKRFHKESEDVEKRAEIKTQLTNLQTEFSSTIYGQYAALLLARFAVEEKRFVDAEELLQPVIQQVEAGSLMRAVIRLRLAKVLIAQKKHSEALLLLEDRQQMQRQYAELRGDILLTLKRPQEAVAAYQEAQSVDASAVESNKLLQLKISSIPL